MSLQFIWAAAIENQMLCLTRLLDGKIKGLYRPFGYNDKIRYWNQKNRF